MNKTMPCMICMLIKRFLNLRVFKVLVHSFVFSIIDYCLSIRGHTAETKIQILQSKVNFLLGSYFYPRIVNKFQRQNRIAHHYNNTNYVQPAINYTTLWQRCNLLSVAERLKYFDAIFAFKSITRQKIPEISNLFEFGSSSRTNSLKVITHNCKIFENSPIYQAIKIWNDLPRDAKELNIPLCKFKSLLAVWFLDCRESEFVFS